MVRDVVSVKSVVVAGKKGSVSFTIDCTKPVEDKIMEVISREMVIELPRLSALTGPSPRGIPH
jgi:large subunit ribosomal protein L22e